MDELGTSFSELIFGNGPVRWMAALGVAAAVLAVVSLWRWLVLKRLRALAFRTNTFLDDVAVVLAENTAGPLVVLIALLSGLGVLNLGTQLPLLLRPITIVLVLIQFGVWGRALIVRGVEGYAERNREVNPASAGTARLIGVLARFVLYSVVLLLILDNIPGVQVTTLIASLGIGGVAVALATQNILGDIIASLSIAFDKPFVVGDFIAVGEEIGTVEQIGIKTTRLRSLSGEQISLPNGNLVASRIRNLSRMEQRRVAFSFRVPYDTPADRLRAIPELARQQVERQVDTRFDRAHLLRFDDLGLAFEVVYFVLTPDFMRYSDIQQAINLGLIEGLAALDVGFAFLSDGVTGERRNRQESQP